MTASDMFEEATFNSSVYCSVNRPLDALPELGFNLFCSRVLIVCSFTCFNEVNTLPGFTSISMYPKMMEASGMPYPKLLSRLIEIAMAKQAEKHALKRDR